MGGKPRPKASIVGVATDFYTDANRFYIPGLVLKVPCACGAMLTQDLGAVELDWVVVNEDYITHVECGGCGKDPDVKLRLNVTLEVK